MRAYFAGGMATTALVAAAVTVFGSLAAYVAFKGVPIGDDRDGSDAVVVGDPTAPPERLRNVIAVRRSSAHSTANTRQRRAASAAGRTASAGGSESRRQPSSAPSASSSSGPAASGTNATPEATPGAGPSPSAPAPDASRGGSAPDPSAPSEPAPSKPAPSKPAPSSQSGALGGAVEDLESTTDQVVDLPVGQATQGITEPVDTAVTGTLNQVGGAVGNPELGDQVNDTVGQVTGSVLGEGGLTDQVVGDGGLTDQVLGEGGLTDRVLGQSP